MPTHDLTGCGVVLAATGAPYIALAQHALSYLRRSNPELPVDLFADAIPENHRFDQVHTLDKSWFRPKFEAIRRSRFERTLYLDSDIMVMADISDVFWLLSKYDIAGAHVQTRNLAYAHRLWRTPIPNSFPQINGGVLAVRRSDQTRAFFDQVERALDDSGMDRDQPILRELLWESDLSLAVLPPEYNLRKRDLLSIASSSDAAPRILHNSDLNKQAKAGRGFAPKRLYGALVWSQIPRLIAADRGLGGRGKVPPAYNLPKLLVNRILQKGRS